MSKKEYRNSIKSRMAIKQAVVTLLSKKKDFYSITVSDVCVEANLNRGTFYNHYDNIGEVANDIENDLMLGMTAAWAESRHSDASIANFITTVTAKLIENEVAYKQLVDYIPNYFFDDLKSKFLTEIEPDFRVNGSLSDYAKATIEILSSGIVSLYLDYFQGRSHSTLLQLQNYCIQVVNAALKARNSDQAPAEL
jgi:AcrR family transcriptional regulator